MADLQEIFSRIKAQQEREKSQTSTTDTSGGRNSLPFQPQILQRSTQPSGQAPQSIWAPQTLPPTSSQNIRAEGGSGYRKPEVSSPMFSPPAHTPEPIHPSRVISPVIGSQTSAAAVSGLGSDERRNQLLNLLKFNTNAGAGPSVKIAVDEKATTEKKDLPAQLIGIGSETSKKSETTEGPPKETQDFLLNLLKGPTGGIGQHLQHASHSRPATRDAPSNPTPPLVVQKQVSVPVQQPSPQQPGPSVASMFTYANPFDALHTSSPLHANRSPKPEQPSESHKESVSHALEGIAKQASDGAKDALDRATSASAQLEDTPVKQRAAAEPNQFKTDSEHESSWETQEDEVAAREQNAHLPVYNFPMLPFRTVKLQLPTPTSRTFAPESLMPIAKHKKPFSQDDRCLATASMGYIVYAQPGTNPSSGKKDPNFGFRVLRQDTGKHQQVFSRVANRVVDVRISPGALDGEDDAAIATTEDGSVFWKRLPDAEIDFDAMDDRDCFIIPPLDTGGENNPSGGAVKTRARSANKTAKIFALSRGKSVFLVTPSIAMSYMGPSASGVNRRIDTQRFFQDHSLAIKAGKSVKDFAFAPDDSCMVTLDKGGKVKFWDLAPLLQHMNQNPGNAAHTPFAMSECLHTIDASTIATGETGEKLSVSSVMLLDKGRPFEKGTALRYLLVGLKQNHVLQLWDLGLGKCVQALQFPSTPEDGLDGMLSLSYSPKNGIIAIGSPGRNSVFFIHLSAPKYNLSSMSQASYVRQLAAGGHTLPRPESTSIMSGIREIRLGTSKSGMELLSLDMLIDPPEKGESGAEDEVLFELYAAHSRGLTTLSIRKQELGWHPETGKVLKSIEAEKEGFITLGPLVENATRTEASKVDVKEEVSTPKKGSVSSKSGSTKKTAVDKDQKIVKETSIPTTTNGVSKKRSEKVEKQSGAAATTKVADVVPLGPAEPVTATTPAAPVQEQTEKTGKATSDAAVTTDAISNADKAVNTTTDPLPPAWSADGTATDFSTQLNKAMDTLRNTIDEDRRVYDANSAAKQDAILRLVSQTLTDNVEKSLSRIINDKIDNAVLPLMTSITRDTVVKTKEGVTSAVEGAVRKALSDQLNKAVRSATAQALKEPDVITAMAGTIKEQVEKSMNQHKNQLEKLFKQSENAGKVAAESQQQTIEKKFAAQAAAQVVAQRDMQQVFEKAKKDDAEKIASLTTEVRNLTEAMQKIAEGQLSFQRQMIDMQQAKQAISTPTQLPKQPVKTGSIRAEPSDQALTYTPNSSDPDDEVANLTQMLEQNRWDDATIAWLQSPNQSSLFYELFSKVNPLYLKHVSPLVALSVSAAITTDITSEANEAAGPVDASKASASLNIVELKMRWLDTVLREVDLAADEIQDVVQQLLAVIEERVRSVHNTLAAAETATTGPTRAHLQSAREKVHGVWKMLGNGM